MQPTTTIDITDTLGTGNAPESLQDIAKSAIISPKKLRAIKAVMLLDDDDCKNLEKLLEE